MDLDQSGHLEQLARVYLGPSLGWFNTQVKPIVSVTVAGTVTVTSGQCVFLVNVSASVTINLPDVRSWLQEPNYNPATGFERAIWIKDLGGNASGFPITVSPFSTQTIDMLAQNFLIVQNRQLLRLYPIPGLNGWFSG